MLGSRSRVLHVLAVLSVIGVVGACGDALAHSFDGQAVGIAFEWGATSYDPRTVIASNLASPDVTSYPDVSGGRGWSIDFDHDVITLQYIGAGDYMYSPGVGMPAFIGFHFSDPNGTLPHIQSVTLANAAGSDLITGFSTSNLSFSENELFVNLIGTMFHHHAMPGMPGTLGRDTIVLDVRIHPIPEPHAFALAASGLLGLCLAERRRRAA